MVPVPSRPFRAAGDIMEPRLNLPGKPHTVPNPAKIPVPVRLPEPEREQPATPAPQPDPPVTPHPEVVPEPVPAGARRTRLPELEL